MKISPEELASGKLSEVTLESAVRQVRLNGYVLLEDVLPTQQVDELNVEFLQELEEKLQSNPEATEVNKNDFRKNRIRMDLPFRMPFIHPQILANSFAIPVIDRLIGEDCRCFYFAVDAPMKGSDYQNVHGDYSPYYPESNITLPPTCVIVNIPLVDVTEKNGPMDAWPGTHLTPENLFTPKNVQAAAEHIQPVSLRMGKGSILIRDVRMWHRGTPNHSDEIRPNVALVYGRKWWGGFAFQKPSLGITRSTYEGFSERVQKLFRFEKLVEV
jgi:ectoine hydroxylase-related dioxygenase (phytanoyl-CoA dioxygenase family)